MNDASCKIESNDVMYDGHKTRIHIAIPTYNRPNQLLLLLKELCVYRDSYHMRINIFDDASTEDYSAVKSFIRDSGISYKYITSGKNLGKVMFWKTNNRIFNNLKSDVFDYYIQIPDDVDLVDEFIPRLINMINDIKQPVLSYCTCTVHTEMFEKAGVNKENINGIEYWTNGWIDGAYIATRVFFDMIGFEIDPVDKKRWVTKPLSGSGVCSKIRAKYKRHGSKIYHTCHSMVKHGTHDSVLNPKLRIKQPMISVLLPCDEK